MEEDDIDAKAKAAIAEASKAREAEVAKALQGGTPDNPSEAPAIAKGKAFHFKKSFPAMYGKKSVLEVLGCGVQNEGDGPDGAHVHMSQNLGVKGIRGVEEDFRLHALEMKKSIRAAQMFADHVAQKSHYTNCPKWWELKSFKGDIDRVVKDYTDSTMSDFTQTLNVGFYFQEFELDIMLVTMLQSFIMKSLISNVPGFSTVSESKLEGTTFTATAQTQAEVALTAQPFSASHIVTQDIQEDSAPAILEAVMFDLVRAIARDWERALLNGDDTITSSVQGDGHMDSDTAGGAATLQAKTFKGFRKLALANSTYAGYDASGATYSKSVLDNVLLKMGKFGLLPKNLIHVVGVKIAQNIRNGSIPELLTLNTIGGAATLLTGDLPPIYGVVPYASEYVREDLGVAGVYTSASVLTTDLILDKTRFWLGFRTPVRVWTTPSLANADQMYCAAKQRGSFGGVAQSSSEVSVGIGYNIATS